MIYLQIAYHTQTHQLPFSSMEEATTEKEKLDELLRQSKFRNDRPEIYIIRCPTGDMTVVLERVEAVRIYDLEIDVKMHEEHNEMKLQRAIEINRRYAEAGIIALPVKDPVA